MLVLLLLAGIFLGTIIIYNRFVRLDNLVKEAWSGIDVQLKRRYTLIPNLLALIKGYMKYEAQTLQDIINTRNNVLQQKNLNKQEEYENTVTNELKHLLALAEDYPELKASEQFLELQHTLSDIENTLQIARRYYNATVRDYNIALHSFPSNLVSFFCHLKDKTYFEILPVETKNIKVKLYEK